jgi:hypothetical protein
MGDHNIGRGEKHTHLHTHIDDTIHCILIVQAIL